jgi:hypothetical protein
VSPVDDCTPRSCGPAWTGAHGRQWEFPAGDLAGLDVGIGVASEIHTCVRWHGDDGDQARSDHASSTLTHMV